MELHYDIDFSRLDIWDEIKDKLHTSFMATQTLIEDFIAAKRREMNEVQNTNDVDDAGEADLKCSVCLVKKAEYAGVPKVSKEGYDCGHVCLCLACSETPQCKSKCPVCRVKVCRWLKVFGEVPSRAGSSNDAPSQAVEAPRSNIVVNSFIINVRNLDTRTAKPFPVDASWSLAKLRDELAKGFKLDGKSLKMSIGDTPLTNMRLKVCSAQSKVLGPDSTLSISTQGRGGAKRPTLKRADKLLISKHRVTDCFSKVATAKPPAEDLVKRCAAKLKLMSEVQGVPDDYLANFIKTMGIESIVGIYTDTEDFKQKMSESELNKVAPYFFTELKEVNETVTVLDDMKIAFQSAFNHLYNLGYLKDSGFDHDKFKKQLETRKAVLEHLASGSV
jgi:hypothetical protein